MRPQNLKFPFTWKDRKPFLHKGVFIVPSYYAQHEDWVDQDQLFIKDKNLAIEYCSGNGDWVIEKALEEPNFYWIAVEKQFERVRKIWSKMHNQNISNLLIVCGEAHTFTKFYLPEKSVQKTFVNFPDPWPKTKHAKHRLIQDPFVQELSRVLDKKGQATFVTDDKDYSMQIIHTMNRSPHWQSLFADPYYSFSWPSSSGKEYGYSWFENLWRAKGLNFYYMQFEKIL